MSQEHQVDQPDTDAQELRSEQPTAAEQPVLPEELQVLTAESSEDEDLEAQLAYENLKRRREAKKRKRIIVIAIVAVIAVVAAIVFIMGQAGSSEEVEEGDSLITAVVYRGDFSTQVTANGATEPLASTVVTPEVDGIIEDLQVQEGSQVNEGDVLFTLKNEDLDREVRDANNELASAQRSANSANNAVDDAYAAYNRAVDAGNDTGDWTGFDEAALRSAITSAEDAYASALATVESARSKVSEAEAKSDKRTVRAPVSGTIVSMSAKNGAAFGSITGASNSRSNEALMQISDLSQMKVTVQVNEVDISYIAEGQTATATFSALPGVELAATVQHIATVATGSNAEGGAGGVVTYAVDLIIPEPDQSLRPGMTATVSIITQSAPDSLIVPTAALQQGESGTYVTVVADAETGETRDVPVEVVEKNTSEAAVKGELNEGDKVLLVSGATGAMDGADAELLDVDAEMAG